MRDFEKVYRRSFIVVFAITILTFIVVFMYLFNQSRDFLNAFLIASSTAGFSGLIGQFLLMMIQEYVKRKTYRIAYICRESEFSKSMSEGIKDYFTKVLDVEFHEIFITKSENEKQEFIDYLSDEGYRFDGLIVRPLDVSDEFLLTINEILGKKTEVTLVDINFSDKQLSSFNQNYLPSYVGSDFSVGGKMIANSIKELVIDPNLKTKILLLMGPEKFPSSRKRSKSLLWELSKTSLMKQTDIIYIDTFDKNSCIETLDKAFNENLIQYNDLECLILFCGNDTIALTAMESEILDKNSHLSQLSKSGTNIVYIGYDGIKNYSNDYLLNKYKMPFITIDVLPYNQGLKAAENLYNKVANKKHKIRLQELIKPNVIRNLEVLKNESNKT